VSGELAEENPYRFSTKYLDEEVGLYYYGYRMYSPGLGRWPSRDPLGDEAHRLRRRSELRQRLARVHPSVDRDLSAFELVALAQFERSHTLIALLPGGQPLPPELQLQLDPLQNLQHLYRFAQNNALMYVDPNGEFPVVATIVAAAAVVTLVAVLPDWDADGLTTDQATLLQTYIATLWNCASDASNTDEIRNNLDAMTVTGIFESGEPDGDNDVSETRNGWFFGYSNRTLLANDFFSRDDVRSRLTTLVHESYHAGTEDWTETRSYDYADEAMRDMKCCLERLWSDY
jgi:hypothetical protein